jgi:RHS repeat-associated protein
LGTPQQLIQKNGAKVWGGEYRAFGELTAETGSWENRLRFPGQYFDQETGNFYNYFRDYDPTTGRYLQSDPIGLKGGLNTYAYVGGNPIANTDAMGLVSSRTGPTGYPCTLIAETPVKMKSWFGLIYTFSKTCHYYCGPDQEIKCPGQDPLADDYFRSKVVSGLTTPECPVDPFDEISVPM